MIKKLLFVSIATIFAMVVFSLNGYSQGGYIKYTLNGESQDYGDDDVNCYYKEGERDENDKQDFVETVGHISTFSKSKDQFSFNIRTPKGTMPNVGQYPFMSRSTQTKVLPNVCIILDREIKDEYSFYGTNDSDAGTFEITKVEGRWIEGTFEVTLSDMYDKKTPKLKITKGSFRVEVRKFGGE